MKGVVKYALGRGNVDLRDFPEPSPCSNEVKIEVKAAGICGSDIHIFHNDIPIPVNPPVVIGHEFSGVISEIGSSITRFNIGDRVTSETSIQVCGQCAHCKRGNYNICPEKRLLGYWFNGAFTKYCVVPSHLVHTLPDNTDFFSGAMCEPLACCVNGVLDKTLIKPADVVVIAGPGTIGLLSLQIVKAIGGTVVLCGTSKDADRLRIGKKLGANIIIDVENENPLKIVSEYTKEGCDVFIDCSGSAKAVRLGFDLVKRGGQYTQIGLVGKQFNLNFDTIVYKELKVRGSFGQKWTSWKKGISLLEKELVKTKDLISHVLPISEWEKAFKKMEQKEGIKIILTPLD